MPVAFDTAGMERHDDRTWFDPRTGDQVSLTYIGMVPDIPAPLDDLPRLRRKLAEETAETGAIIEAHVVRLAGLPTLLQLIKLPIPGQDTGLAFIAAFTVPKATCSAVLRIQCTEGQTTGFRESTVAAQIGFDRCFPPHPYAPDLRGQLPYNVADEATWDQQFPDHALTRARAWAHRTLATAQVDPRFATLSPFEPGPHSATTDQATTESLPERAPTRPTDPDSSLPEPGAAHSAPAHPATDPAHTPASDPAPPLLTNSLPEPDPTSTAVQAHAAPEPTVHEPPATPLPEPDPTPPTTDPTHPPAAFDPAPPPAMSMFEPAHSTPATPPHTTSVFEPDPTPSATPAHTATDPAPPARSLFEPDSTPQPFAPPSATPAETSAAEPVPTPEPAQSIFEPDPTHTPPNPQPPTSDPAPEPAPTQSTFEPNARQSAKNPAPEPSLFEPAPAQSAAEPAASPPEPSLFEPNPVYSATEPAPAAERPPAEAGDVLHTVLVGLPLGGYLPLWQEDGVTFWRMSDPEAVRARLGAGVESRSEIDKRRFREAAMFSPSRGTLFLMDRHRDASGHLGGTSTQLTPATKEEAYAAVDDKALSEMYVWLGDVVLDSVRRGEFVAVESGGWQVPMTPVVLVMLRTDGRAWHSVVETSPVPVGAPVWRDQQPVDGKTQVLASPANDRTVRAAGLLTRFAVATWGMHPFQLGLSFGPNPTLPKR